MIRLTKPEESQQVIEWISTTPNNGYDPDVLGYESTITFCAERDKPIMYLPIQVTLTLESLGRNPEATHRETVLALNEMLEKVKEFAKAGGIREIYFLSCEKGTIKQAEKFGFHRVMEDRDKGMVLFNMKVANG